MKFMTNTSFFSTLAFGIALTGSALAQQSGTTCGQTYTVVGGDSLSRISLKVYGSTLYQPIYSANVDVIGTNPDRIFVGQQLTIPCLGTDGTTVATAPAGTDDGPLVLTFNKASAPPFIINSGIVDGYLADITTATEGRVTFVDPEVMNRKHDEQLALVTSGQVDGAYVLNTTIAQEHPLLQLSMLPMFGGSAEQTATAMWFLHDEYLDEANYFTEAELLGFIAAPAAHIWHGKGLPITPSSDAAGKNEYAVPYFMGLDTRGPQAMRTEFSALEFSMSGAGKENPLYFMAHGAAVAIGLWSEDSNYAVMEVDNGLYTPTFSVVLSNEAWAQISPEDQEAIRAISGAELARRSAAWDAFDNSFRSVMFGKGLVWEKANRALTESLWLGSRDELRAWMSYADQLGIPSAAAIDSYVQDLRNLEDLLIYLGPESYVDQNPFVPVTN
ncbi:MAG: LysM peptidoglycan-binding domain-containing protein [Pseudomonadota bacterium]